MTAYWNPAETTFEQALQVHLDTEVPRLVARCLDSDAWLALAVANDAELQAAAVRALRHLLTWGTTLPGFDLLSAIRLCADDLAARALEEMCKNSEQLLPAESVDLMKVY